MFIEEQRLITEITAEVAADIAADITADIAADITTEIAAEVLAEVAGGLGYCLQIQLIVPVIQAQQGLEETSRRLS